MDDLISRRAAIDAIEEMQMPIMRSEFPEEQFVFTGMSEALSVIKELPSAQPDPLTEEEKRLLKKLRSYHSGSYAKILDKLVASAQPEIIRCGECTHKDKKIDYCHCLGITICECDYCSFAERRTDG